MPKLTDAQLVILSAAAERADRTVLPLPKSLRLNKGAVSIVLKSLLKNRLIAEKPASGDDAVWREAKDGQRLTLVITDAGLTAIGVDKDKEAAAPAQAPVSSGTKPESKPARSASKHKPTAKTSGAKQRPGTKQALLIDLLRRKEGATIPEITKATGWQVHSVRGAISGSLKKKLGLAVASETVEGRGRVYRIAGRV